MAWKKKIKLQTTLSEVDIERILQAYLRNNSGTHSGFASGRFFKVQRTCGKGLSYSSPAIITGEIKVMDNRQQITLTVKMSLSLIWKIFLTFFYSLLIFLARDILFFGRSKGVSAMGIVILAIYGLFPLTMIFNEIRKDIKTIRSLLVL